MRRAAIALLLAAAAGCNGSAPRTPPQQLPNASVKLRRHKVAVVHLDRDPARRYPLGPGTLCSWDRDRYLHVFSADGPKLCDIVFLDATGLVVEMAELDGFNETGISSKNEVRRVLFLSAGALKKDGTQIGDKVEFSPEIVAAKVDPMPVVKVGGHAVHVETCHRLTERARGLMHRPRLSKDDGMLFLYPLEDKRDFWMLNTLLPLDIAYFDAAGRLLNVARMKPHEDPSKGADLKATSIAYSRFVLEVNYGWFDARGLIDAEGLPKKPVLLELPAALRRLADEAE